MSDDLGESKLDPVDAGRGMAPVVIAAVIAGGVVTALSVPLFDVGIAAALVNGIVAGGVAAGAALVGQRHAAPE